MCVLTYVAKMLQVKRETDLPDWLISLVNNIEIDTKFLLKEIEQEEIRAKRDFKQ